MESDVGIVYFVNVKIKITTHQVVLFAVYAYFTLALIAEQQHCNEPFIPVPIFLILKVFVVIKSPLTSFKAQ